MRWAERTERKDRSNNFQRKKKRGAKPTKKSGYKKIILKCGSCTIGREMESLMKERTRVRRGDGDLVIPNTKILPGPAAWRRRKKAQGGEHTSQCAGRGQVQGC